MSKHQTELLLSLSSHEVIKACERAANTLGWRVTQKHSAGLTCTQVAPTPMATGNPVTVEITLSSTSDNATKIALKGKNFGFGPFQFNYVKQRLQEFSEAIERAVSQRESSEASTSKSCNVIINGVRLTDEQVRMLEQRYNTRVQDGAYWYDRICGAWGGRMDQLLALSRQGLKSAGHCVRTPPKVIPGFSLTGGSYTKWTCWDCNSSGLFGQGDTGWTLSEILGLKAE